MDGLPAGPCCRVEGDRAHPAVAPLRWEPAGALHRARGLHRCHPLGSHRCPVPLQKCRRCKPQVPPSWKSQHAARQPLPPHRRVRCRQPRPPAAHPGGCSSPPPACQSGHSRSAAPPAGLHYRRRRCSAQSSDQSLPRAPALPAPGAGKGPARTPRSRGQMQRRTLSPCPTSAMRPARKRMAFCGRSKGQASLQVKTERRFKQPCQRSANLSFECSAGPRNILRRSSCVSTSDDA
jgi:hypothetical protein